MRCWANNIHSITVTKSMLGSSPHTGEDTDRSIGERMREHDRQGEGQDTDALGTIHLNIYGAQTHNRLVGEIGHLSPTDSLIH